MNGEVICQNNVLYCGESNTDVWRIVTGPQDWKGKAKGRGEKGTEEGS